jgi:ABC-type uncharacterized transport system auxiliary subunit
MRRDRSDLGTRFALVLVLVAAVAATACPSKLAMTPQTFTIDPPPPRPSPAPGATRVLALRQAEAAPTYAGVDLVYRVGPHAVERDAYASFAAPPASMLTMAIRVYLRDADWVRDVVMPGEGVPVDAEIEPAIVELAGDFTSGAEPAAVLTLQFRVLAPGAGAPAEKEILLKVYTRRKPLSQRTAVAVVAAWNEELGEIMAEFIADLQKALPTRR